MRQIWKNYAGKYRDVGLQVVPIKPGTKVCFEKGWQEPDPERFNEERFDDHGIGLLTGSASGVVAVDIDNGDILQEVLKILPPTPCWKVGSKGATYFYKFQDQVSNPKIYLNGIPAIEILQDGQQTVLPPTLHPNGKEYSWGDPTNDLLNAFQDIPLFGSHVVDQLRLLVNKKQNLLTQKSFTGRDNHLTEMAWAAVCKNKPREVIITELLEIDQRHHNPPFATDTTEQKTRNKTPAQVMAAFVDQAIKKRGVEYQPSEENIIEIGTEFLDIVVDQENTMTYTQYPIPPGKLGELVSLIDSSARRSQINYSLGAATALLGVVFANKYTCNETFSNTYNLNVGETGSGKENGQRIIKSLLSLNRKLSWLGESYGSDQAYLDGIAEKLERLDVVDECSALLKESCNPTGNSNFKKLANHMMEIYSKPGSFFQGHRTVTKGASSTIFSPCLSFYGSTTPESFATAINMKDFHTGLMTRFNVFFGNPSANLIIFPSKPALEQMQAILKPSMDTYTQKDAYGRVYNFKPVEFDRNHFAAIVEEVESFYQKSTGILKALHTRQIEKMCKYLIYCAALENPNKPMASREMLDWAYSMTLMQIKQLEMWFDYTETSLHNLIYRECAAHGKNGITKSYLTMKFKNYPKRLRDDTFQELTENNRLITRSFKSEKSKKPTEYLYAVQRQFWF